MRNYSDEIQRGAAAEPIVFRPADGYAELPGTPTATLTVTPPGAAAPFAPPIPMTWDAARKRFTAALDTRDEVKWPAGGGYRADLSVTLSGRLLRWTFFFDVLSDPWRPNLTTADLLALAPVSAFEDGRTAADLTGVIQAAEDGIRLALRARGLCAGWLGGKGELDACLTFMALSLLYGRLAGDDRSGYWTKHLGWNAQYERALARLLARVELTEEGAALAGGRASNRSGARLTP